MKMKRRRIIKERSFSSDNALIKQALEAAIKAKQLLDDAAGTIRDAVGETFLFARLDSHSMDLDDTIDDIKGVLNGTVDPTDDTVDDTSDFENPFLESRKRFGNKFVGESDGGRWSEYGEFLGQLPMDCIMDCSHSGKCDSEVEYWTDQLAFADGLPIDKAIEFISEYGAWDREELSQKSPEEIAQIVLWIFCGNLKDEAYQFMRDGDSEDWPDLDDWDEKDWRRFQEEQCYLGLNN